MSNQDYVVTTELQPTYSTPAITGERTRKAYEIAESVYTRAEIDAFRDKLRCALAKQVMDNTLMLAVAEANCLQLAPGGREEYRQIVRMYARLAMAEIIGGEW